MEPWRREAFRIYGGRGDRAAYFPDHSRRPESGRRGCSRSAAPRGENRPLRHRAASQGRPRDSGFAHGIAGQGPPRSRDRRLEEERTRLLTRVVLAQEDERRRIARELHDQLGQQLTALRLTLEMLKAQSIERPELRVQVETLEELALQLDQDVAFRVWELRPIEDRK